MLYAFQSEVAGADHNRELALKIVLHVRIARAGLRLEHQVEIKGPDVVEPVISRAFRGI